MIIFGTCVLVQLKIGIKKSAWLFAQSAWLFGPEAFTETPSKCHLSVTSTNSTNYMLPHTRTRCHVPQEVSPRGVEAALEAGKRSCAAGHVPLRHCRWRRSCRFPPRALARRPNVIRVSCCWIRELAPAGRQAPRLHHPGWQLLSIACACVHGASLTSIVGER